MEKTLFSEDYKVLLHLLREVREKAGVTQMDVAACLGTTQSIVSKCERGERRIDVIELRRWCAALGMLFLDFMAEFESSVTVTTKRGGREAR